jgi:hypothetical protein
MDIFDNIVLCKNCEERMILTTVVKDGFKIKALKCPKCSNVILHPEDLKEYEDFKKIKDKQFKVKLRLIGNSYAVSIPREIIDFMNDNELNDMVNMCIRDINRLTLEFENGR